MPLPSWSVCILVLNCLCGGVKPNFNLMFYHKSPNRQPFSLICSTKFFFFSVCVCAYTCSGYEGVTWETYKMQRMLFELMKVLSLRTSVFLISSWLHTLVIDNEVVPFSESLSQLSGLCWASLLSIGQAYCFS